MSYDLSSHKIAAGIAPWTTLYHQYVQAVEDGLNDFDTWKNSTVTPTFTSYGTRIGNLENWKTHTVTPTFTDHSTRISSVEDWVTDTGTPTFTDHSTRIGTLEYWKNTTVGGRIDNLETWKTTTATSTFNSHNTRIGGLEDWKNNTVTPTFTSHNTRIDNIEYWRNSLDTFSSFGLSCLDWLTVVEGFLIDSYAFNYEEKVAGYRSRSLGAKSYMSLSNRLDMIERTVFFINDSLKSIGMSYITEDGTVVPASTPNP